MVNSFTIPLRPVAVQQDRPDTLPIEIAQISSQWGSFRDVNEEILRVKIAEEEEHGRTPQLQKGDEEASDGDTTEHLEQLYKRRADIIQLAMLVDSLPVTSVGCSVVNLQQ